MKQVHIECKPDAQLVSKLGFTRKYITHHQGKSRIFSSLSKRNGMLAMVDEDPGSPKTRYELSLKLEEEFEGIKFYTDPSDNVVLELKGKLEDWIIMVCRKHNISVLKFGLPDKPNDLHDIINYRLPNFSKLIDELIEQKIPAILKLKAWLN